APQQPLMMGGTPRTRWKAVIDGTKPGAKFFLSKTPAEYNPPSYFKSCRKQSTSDFWDHIAKQESQQRQDEQLMEKRKRDIRRQNVDQLRIDGDAMTKELDKELN
ncbi:hypothetical protein BGZ97_007636, partial [Linnemannia gamsii]